jgi:hypothetical protein
MRKQRVLYRRSGQTCAGTILALLADFPGHYAVFLVRDICTRSEYVVNSRDLVYL